ncbi:lipoprotein lipase-like [Euwallacea fornicatus]|uniref:lipoprotein lipase-like n=1 Tax=Euwallacea fornicatus TaxID=995702 RepID=UPI00338F4C94
MSHDRKSHYRNIPRVDFSRANLTDPSSISYKFFTKNSNPEYTVLTEENIELVEFGNDAKTIVLMHGWVSSDVSPWFNPLKEAYLSQGDHNVIFVDWSKYANMSYGESCAYVQPVGKCIANFLIKSGIPSQNLHLIGHSLGSQLAAFTGKAYKKESGKKIGRITGLDPAGPSWSNESMTKEERLNEQDANFVDVVHTDIQLYGFTHPCGHVDFYPNGGTNQPGCPDSDQDANCNHHRATRIFIESVNKKVEASEVNFKEDEEFNILVTPKETKFQVAVFGEHVDTSVRGVFYFETNHSEPFL